jgi:hypothetical protein
MRQDFTLYVYKTDRRYKAGERAIETTVVPNITKTLMAKTVIELMDSKYPSAEGYRIEYFPSKVTVKNLMTGQDVEIDRDTPWCCNPASETYWSM